ncbi:MAG: hypothetical protein HY289_16815 [Planctomycetes bacterium]|nr:hypothetical protein [Planctomycetota bacterium]
MCLIIDTCVAHRFAGPPYLDGDVKPIVAWLLPKKRMSHRHVAIGGKLRSELMLAGENFRRFLEALRQRGGVLDFSDDDVNQESTKVERLFAEHDITGADDPHVIALARVSGSRLLYTEDNKTKLVDLFRDRRFLHPPGRVYKSKLNKSLLRNPKKCKPLK